MSHRYRRPIAALLAAATIGVVVAQPALADSAVKANDTCFATTQWQGWKSPSPSVIYLRINVSDVYRLDLSAPSNELQYPEVHLFSEVRGSDWICSPLDLQLWVADDGGHFREPLFVKSITRLSSDEVKAIPAKYRP